MSIKEIHNQIYQLKNRYDKQQIDSQRCITEIHNLKNIGLKYGMNIDNYLYRNGILNKPTALLSAKENIHKYQKLPNYQKKFKKEIQIIQDSKQKWFNNYGIHDSPLHDLVKPTLDKYKVDGLLNSLLCDLYVGTYNEGSTKDLMEI